MRRTQRQRSAARRGFTLVELLIVVAMVGVLAAIAMVGYRKYMNAAGIAEPKAVMQGIRGAQESYRAEMLIYLPVSGSLTSWYPSSDLGDRKHAWLNPGHGDYERWRQLNVTTDGTVRFGYATVAGVTGDLPMDPGMTYTWSGLSESPLLNANHSPNGGPWYVIQAAGDRDNDDTYALLLTASTMPSIYWENDTE